MPKLGFVNALGPFQTVVDDLVTGVLIREDEKPLREDISLPIEGARDTYKCICEGTYSLNFFPVHSDAVFRKDEFNSDDKGVLPGIWLQLPASLLSI